MPETARTPLRDQPLSLILLSLAGLVISVYLARIHYFLYGHPEFHKFFCDISETFDCSYVVSSPWSEIIPGVPIAAVAAGLFFALFVIYAAFGRMLREAGLAVGFLLSMAAVVAAAGYLAVMVLVVKHACALCLALDVVIAATAALYLWNFKRWGIFRGARAGDMVGLLAVAFLCVAGMIFGLKLMLDRELHQEVANRILQIEYTPRTSLPFDQPYAGGITLYAFTDLQCPACRQGYTTLEKLREIYGRKLRIISKQFPLDISCNKEIPKGPHAGSCEAALVAISAGQVGRYEEVVPEIYNSDGQFNETLSRLESDPQIHAGMARAEATLQADIADGAAVHITLWPTYFLDGRRIEGPQPLPVWTAVIDELLAKHAAAAATAR